MGPMSDEPLIAEDELPEDEIPAARRRGVYWLPNLLTTGALFSGFYAVVAAIAHQTRPKRPEEGLAAYDAFVARLAALFRAGEVLLTNDDRTADIESILTAAVSVVASSTSRITLIGPTVILGEQATAALALIVHELTTNATKYGALSVPDGRIEIRWQRTSDGAGQVIALHWQELDGPPVRMPAATGFGTQLMSTAMPNGNVTFDYAAAGLQFGLQFRLSSAGPDAK